MWKLRNNPIYEISPHEFREPYSPHAFPIPAKREKRQVAKQPEGAS